VESYTSANGSTWNFVERIAVTVTSPDSFGMSGSVNSTGQPITAFVDSSGNLKKRNHSTAVTTVIDAGTTNAHKGYISLADQDYYYRAVGATLAEKYTFQTAGTNITNNTTANVISTLSGDRALANNGVVFASISFGANANEILVRRLAFTGIYTQNERSDSTLSEWGTYAVSGESASGNTILHEMALASTSPASSYTTITSGSVVSSDSSLIFEKFRITFTLAAFAASEIDSVTVNYTGVGVGALLPTGVLFDNEYYISKGTSADTTNTSVLVTDRGKAWITSEYPVSFMARYRSALYAGSATNGNIYKLRQGYRAVSSAYTMTATSKEDLLGSVELEKEVYKIFVLYEVKPSGTFNFAYRTDNFKTSGGSTYVSTSVDQTTAGIAEIPYIGGPFRTIQFRITSNDLDAQVGILGYVVMYAYLNVR